jgi:hypothetical protein
MLRKYHARKNWFGMNVCANFIYIRNPTSVLSEQEKFKLSQNTQCKFSRKKDQHISLNKIQKFVTMVH